MPDMTRVATGQLGYVGVTGEAVRIDTGILFPNGLAVTDGGEALLVDETATGRVYRFAIEAPGRLGPREPYAELGPRSTPDGMCFDVEGRLYVAGHGSHSVFVIAAGGGEVEEVIGFDDAEITNVCFGGPEHKTLYVTQCVAGAVATVERAVPGMRLHPDRVRT
jgi:gluconolactonase